MEKLLKNLWLIFAIYFSYSQYSNWEEGQNLISAQRDRLPAIEGSITRERKKWKKIQQFKKDLKNAQTEFDQANKKFEEIKRKLPEKINNSAVISLLKNISKDINIKSSQTAPGSELNKGFYSVKSFKYNASGTYLQFLIFLEKISKQERVYNVKGVSFKANRKSNKGRFQKVDAEIDLEVYRYNKEKEKLGDES